MNNRLDKVHFVETCQYSNSRTLRVASMTKRRKRAALTIYLPSEIIELILLFGCVDVNSYFSFLLVRFLKLFFLQLGACEFDSPFDFSINIAIF